LVNDGQPESVVRKLECEIWDLSGKTFATLGVTYKSNVDDMRESPAVEVVHALEARGAQIRAYAPFVDRVRGLETIVDSIYSLMCYNCEDVECRDCIAHWFELYSQHLGKCFY
jgi:UDP-glucose 6-dehydrogenase